jgi:methylthioxylose transferase
MWRAFLLVGAAAGLVVITREWGLALERRGVVILLAQGEPLAGPVQTRLNMGTLRLVELAVIAVIALPVCCQRLSWRWLLLFAAGVELAWSVALASVDGWQRGFVGRLTGRDEYLHDVSRIHRGFLADFIPGIAHHWATHVAGHPPGAVLTFWVLNRIGLPGAGAAAIFCVLAGALAIPAVLITVRVVADERIARLAAPFLMTAPAAIWIAVSADAWFLCVSAWGIAALAIGTRLSSLAGGVLLGASLFLSYGLVLLAPVAIGVVVAQRRFRPLLLGSLGVIAVTVAFGAAGFWWWDGVVATNARVASGDAGARPYLYFVFANIAALAIAVGPATVAALSRRLTLLPATALLGLAIADVAGVSRGEVERIWLPFMPWLIVACAGLPGRRWWLAAQLVVGICVQTLVVSLW